MTHLRTVMIEELVRRNYSERTHECYIRCIEDFALYFNCSPDKLGLEHIRHYQAHLFTDKKLSPNTVNQRLAALRFFFVKTLHRPWNTSETPYPKRVISLPHILSPEEVGVLIESADLPFHRVILMTLYATGVRRAELANMRVSDIDSKRMVIRVRGKGLKDRLCAAAHKRSYVPGKVMCSGTGQNLWRQAPRYDCAAHNYLPLSEAMSLSVGRKRPRLRLGGRTASSISRFCEGSVRRYASVL